DLEHGTMGRAMTAADIAESTILGGADVAVYRRPIPGGTLRFAVRGKWPFSGDHLADVLGRTAAAQRLFWGSDVKGPFLVTLFSIEGTGSSGGTGRTDAFALYGTTDTPESRIRRTIAHEHMHSWIPTRIGRLPDGETEALEYWLSEGFTDFYAERTLLKAGIWSLEDFVSDLNDMLLAYDTSPARNAPNARIAKEFWTNAAIEQLPYQRGMLFAYLLDYRIRQASRGERNLDSVMFAMRDAFVAAPDARKPGLVDNFRRAFHAQTTVDVAKALRATSKRARRSSCRPVCSAAAPRSATPVSGCSTKASMSTRRRPRASSPASTHTARLMRQAFGRACAGSPGSAAGRVTRAWTGPIGSATGRASRS